MTQDGYKNHRSPLSPFGSLRQRPSAPKGGPSNLTTLSSKDGRKIPVRSEVYSLRTLFYPPKVDEISINVFCELLQIYRKSPQNLPNYLLHPKPGHPSN